MKKSIGSYPRVRIEGGGRAVVSQAGGVLLVETVRKAGLDTATSVALAPWRKPRAVHDPGKILLDVALAVALGRDCLADVGVLRAEPDVSGPVASDPTVSRLMDTLAASGEKDLRAIRALRAEVRQHVWRLAGQEAPAAGGTVTVDLDGVLVIAHSDKEDAAPTWKRTYGHHPTGSGPTAEEVPARAPDPDPHRLRGRHSRLPRLARPARTVAVLLARHDGHRAGPPAGVEDPRIGLDAGRRDGRRDPRRRLGRRTHRRRADRLVQGHEADH